VLYTLNTWRSSHGQLRLASGELESTLETWILVITNVLGRSRFCLFDLLRDPLLTVPDPTPPILASPL
jgi:hypothetical protein